ncbi:hypothetical protein THOD04_210001 [Vibrio owensii]|nr:hypothetical protein THOD04_210001 [Vibrio owensii]
MFHELFRTLFWNEFKSKALNIFSCPNRRLLVGLVALLQSIAEKLMLIKSLGYWSDFRVCEKRAIIITPSDREFSPK